MSDNVTCAASIVNTQILTYLIVIILIVIEGKEFSCALLFYYYSAHDNQENPLSYHGCVHLLFSLARIPCHNDNAVPTIIIE